MNETREFQVRSWSARTIEEIGQWVSQNSGWSRFHGGNYAVRNGLEVGLPQGRGGRNRQHGAQVPKKAVLVYLLNGQVGQRLCP